MSQQEYPSAAFALSLAAGILVLLVGLFLALIGAVLSIFMLGVGAFIGVLGIVWGIIIIVGAMNLRSHPEQHVTWGTIILVFSVISWVGAFGGFFLGFLLGLIGGILAITWRPTQAPMAPTYAAPPSPAMTTASATRYCPNCGAPVTSDSTFCPHCGKQLPPQ